MTPSQAPPLGLDAAEGQLPTVSACVSTLTARVDFQRAARGPRFVMSGFILQMRRRRPYEAVGMRIGFTCSKKVGNAVARNRAKRRLREIARLVLTQHGQDGTDYVLIGRHGVTATLPFEQMQADLLKAVRKLHTKPK